MNPKTYRKITNIKAIQITEPIYEKLKWGDEIFGDAPYVELDLTKTKKIRFLFTVSTSEIIGSYVVWNETNTNDVWIVDKETFEKTYEEVK